MEQNTNIKSKIKSNIFNIIICLIIIFQNSFLKNYPILLLIFGIFIIDTKYNITLKGNSKKLIIYWFYLTIITCININTNFNLNKTINILTQYVIIFLGIFLCTQKIDYSKLFYFLLKAGIFVAILGVIEIILKKSIFALALGKISSYTYSNDFRLLSIFEHPIITACFLFLAFDISLFYPLKKTSLTFCARIILLVAIILTKSRCIWISTVFLFILLVYKYRKNIVIKKKSVIIVIITLFILISIMIIFQKNYVYLLINMIENRIEGTLYAGEGQGNIIRIDNILNSFNYWFKEKNFFKFIFGSGKYFDKVFMQEHPVIKWGVPWTAAIDNQYISIIHETGIIGLLLILSIFIKVTSNFVKVPINNKEFLITSTYIISIGLALFFFEGFNFIIFDLFFVLMLIINERTKELKK